MTAATPQRSYYLTGERRAGHRYPIQVDLTFKVRHKGRVVASGNGRTMDLSSRGARILTDKSLPAGGKVELCIAWPAALQDGVALNLFVSGKVVRSFENDSGNYSAVAFRRYLFRVRGARKRPEDEAQTYTFLA